MRHEKKPRILLIGKNGQVGFEALRALAALGKLIAVDRSQCDLRFASSIRQQIEETHPQVIVNAVADTAVDRAESDRDTACAVNASALELIGQYARGIDAIVFHYSTDYAFDGAKPEPYVETDPVAPTSVYGASKLDGERLLAASGCRHIIFRRTSWVFGAYGTNFLKNYAETWLRARQPAYRMRSTRRTHSRRSDC